jgi:hypothetical protein
MKLEYRTRALEGALQPDPSGGHELTGKESESVTKTERHNWSRLNKLQLGKYAEYLVKMEFLLWGCDVFTSEVDDHGIDFVVRTRSGRHYDIQVKSYRAASNSYVYLPKSTFTIADHSLLVLVQFVDGEPATLFLVPSCMDGTANTIFESRDYGEGKKSAPEWGLTLSKKKLARLAEECAFHAVLGSLA